MTKKKPKHKKAHRPAHAASPLLMRLMPGAAPPAPAPEAHENAPQHPLSLLAQLTFSPQHLVSAFALPDKLHAFNAADVWWADNVVRQFEGVDVLQPDAHEKLREWYNRHARTHYKNKREAGGKETRGKRAAQEVIEAEPEDKPTRH